MQSEASTWISWHKQLVSVFGRKTANQLFLLYWEKRGNINSKANTNALREYAEKNGFKIQGDAIAGVVDAFYDIGDAFSDVFKMGKIATIVIMVILLGGIGMLVFAIAKNPIKAGAAIATKGKSLMV